jgi:threonine/homoserine/homoserine lactone efflux protein
MNLLPPAHDLLLFMTAAIVLLIIPGPAVLYIIARSVDQGRKAGMASSSGIATGGLADGVQQVQPAPLRRIYTQGILVQILNPKTAIFFFAFLPQFVNPTRGSVTVQFLALGMLFTVMGFLSDSLWALTAGSAAGWFQSNPKCLRHQHQVSGMVYIGLGMATALGGSRHGAA